MWWALGFLVVVVVAYVAVRGLADLLDMPIGKD